MKLLNEDAETHLWDRTFAELAAEHIAPQKDSVLILTEDDAEKETLQQSIESAVGEPIRDCEVFDGDQQKLPYEPDTFDVTVHSNPSQDVLHRHQPLYQVSSVTKRDGTVVYKAPQWLAHSDAVALDTIYALGWENHSDPVLAAVMTVNITGRLDKYSPIQSTPGETHLTFESFP